MRNKLIQNRLWRRHVAFPSDHGSWVFLLSPFLIGSFAAQRWTPASNYLFLAALSTFLLRQPVVTAVKAYSGRRGRGDLAAARLWILIYGSITLLALLGLSTQGYVYVLVLAMPGMLVFTWHLHLVSRREERHRIGVDVVASGALALAAPAALWVGVGSPDPQGWWLWALTWLQSAASIVYAFLRLEQRKLAGLPTVGERIKMGRRALLYSGFNLAGVAICASLGLFPSLLPLPYGLQFTETIWGTLKPAIGVKPTKIGIRQLLVSTAFTILFVLVWRL